MKGTFSLLLVCLLACGSHAQKKNLIDEKEVLRIESVLAGDEMKGRRAGTPDIDKAAAFIADEFKKAGLQPFRDKSYFQEFHMFRPRPIAASATINGDTIERQRIIAVSSEEDFTVDEHSGYELQYVRAGENLRTRVQEISSAAKNLLVFIDTSFARNFPRLAGFSGQAFGAGQKSKTAIIYILGNYQPTSYRIHIRQAIDDTRFMNVVGFLPGKGKKEEYVIFSGHYDHLGVARQPVNGDSIYNGANDDAAGTTAVIMLARHFKKQQNNERSLLFVAFTAEEMGGFGSRYFSQQLDPAKVVALFNIEMIGTESKWGRNSAYITGFEKSDLGALMQKNLVGTGFRFEPDPYPAENLFYRSDNATLARLGVPAHTISTAKMDGEPNYHKLTDEVKTLDIPNMAAIIQAIALSARSIIAGKDTPSRVALETRN